MNAIQMAGKTFAALDAALAAGTTTTLTLGVAPYYCINGKAYTLATVTNVQPATTDSNTGAALAPILPGYGACIVIGASSGQSTTLLMAQGPQAPLAANTAAFTPGAFKEAPQFPHLPDDFCPLGYVIVKVATDFTSSGYIFGTTNTTATGAQAAAGTAHANTFTSVMVLPDRPQTS